MKKEKDPAKENKQLEVLKRLIDNLNLDKDQIRDLLVTLYQNENRKAILYLIRDLMDNAYIEVDDLMPVCTYDADSILDELGEYTIQRYCECHNIAFDDVEDDEHTNNDPDSSLLWGIKRILFNSSPNS